MSCQVNQSLVGCKVVIETSSIKLQGDVRAVDPTGGKVSIINGVVEPSKDPLPPLYRVFVKEIISINIVGQKEEEASISPKPVQAAVKPVSDPKPPLKSPPSSKIKPLVYRKSLPLHIQKLNNHVEGDVLTNKVPLVQNGVVMKPIITNYVVIDSINDQYYEAISKLSVESDIGVSMEGIRIGRFGTICWIGMAVRNKAFLFDMCSLGPVGFKEGMSNIITNPNILKVTHDCRFMADALLHQYGVRIENVFDTQVAAAVVEKQKTRDFVFNRFVPGLVRCLTDYLPDLPKEKMFMPRARAGNEQEDEKRWAQRPLPEHLMEGAVFNVCHLRRLRLVLMEALTREVTMGTTLYLKEVSELSDDSVSEKYLIAHQLPLSFKDLPQPRTPRNGTVYRDNVPHDFCDPYVGFSRHVPHVRKSPNQNYL